MNEPTDSTPKKRKRTTKPKNNQPKYKRDRVLNLIPTPKKDRHSGSRLSYLQRIVIKAQCDLGASTKTLAKLHNCNPNTIHKVRHDENLKVSGKREIGWIRDALISKNYTTAMRAQMAITDKKLNEASAYQLATITGIAIDKARLMEDKSTSNVAHASLIATIDDDRRKIMERIEKFKAVEYKDVDTQSIITD